METLYELRKQLEEERQLRLNAENLCKQQQETIKKLTLSTNNVSLTQDLNIDSILLDNARLNSIVKNLPLGILIEDSRRKIVLTNHVFCNLFNISIEPDLMIGFDCESAINQSKSMFLNPNEFVESVQSILTKRKVVLDQILFLTDGRIFRRSYIPIFNQEIYSGHLWIYEDVSQKHFVEEKISWLLKIPNESPNPILKCSSDGYILYSNDSAEVFKSPNDKSYISNELILWVKECLQLQRGVKHNFILNYSTYEVQLVPIKNEDYVNIYAFDCSENATVHSDYTLLFNLINESADAILCIQENGKIVFANFESANRLNCSTDALINSNIFDHNVEIKSKEEWQTKFEQIKSNQQSFIQGNIKSQGNNKTVEVNFKYTVIDNKGYVVAVSRDVSERQNAINQLSEQKQFYETILNNLPADIAVFDKYHRYLFVNPLGIKNEEVRKWIIGKTDRDYCIYKNKNIEIANRRIAIHDLVLKEKKQIEWEESANNENENATYYLRRLHPIIVNNEVKLLIGYGINISDRKLIENRLKDSEERYRLIVDASNDCIWDWNVQTGNMFFSDRWKSMLGYSKDDVLIQSIGTWYTHLHHDDIKLAIRAFYDHFLSQEPFNCTLRFKQKNNELTWMMCRGYAIRDFSGKPIRMIGTCTDISSLKNIENKLKASEDKLSILFNNAFDASILVSQSDLKIIETNQRTLELFQFGSKKELVTTDIFELFQNDELKNNWKDIIANIQKIGFYETDIYCQTKNKNAFWANLALCPLIIDSKEVLLLRIADISKQKNLEQELRKAYEISEASIKTKELFLANVSHEIRTPMNGIIGLLDLFNKKNLGPTQLKYFDLIKKNSDNLLFILNDILDFSKLESGRFKIENTNFDVLEVFQNAYNLFKLKAEEKGIQLNLNIISKKQLHLIGDPYRLSQILFNLISNAIKFTDKGSVVIQLEIIEQLDFKVKLKCSIKDTGIGISNEKLQLIFDAFEQANSNTSRKYGGTGLGLAISKKLIELQGGKINVSSDLNIGTIFTFEIGYSIAKNINSPILVKEIDWNQYSDIKILLAEDNEVNQFLINEMLLVKGLKIDIASDGEEAISKINNNYYHLILLDIQMPKVNGEEVISFIRNNKEEKIANLPIIVLTANGLSGDNLKYIQMGATDYLPKPFKSTLLYDKISNVIEQTIDNIEPKPMNKNIYIKAVEGLFDFSFFDQSMINSPDFIKNICEIFIKTTPPQLEALNNAYETKDWKRLASVAHKLKTTITSFHIIRAKEAILEVEQNALQEKNIAETEVLIDQIMQTVQEVIEKIKIQLLENV